MCCFCLFEWVDDLVGEMARNFDGVSSMTSIFWDGLDGVKFAQFGTI